MRRVPIFVTAPIGIATSLRPHVPRLQEHVGYQVAARFHDQPLDLPYLAVGRTDDQFAVYVYRAGWDVVDGDLLRGRRCAPAAGRHREHTPARKHPVRLLRGAAWVRVPGGVEVRHALGLLGGPERLELGEGAAKTDLARRSVHEVNRNKPPRAMPVLGVDCEMRDLPVDRVDDYAGYLTAGSIGAPGVGADPERHHLRHPPGFPWTLASPASGASEFPGRGQPHLAGHSLGQW
jgi:hypothetical protein